MNAEFKVETSARAKEEIQIAYAYYESLRPGLGKLFAASVRERFRALKANPLIGSYLFGYVRKVIVKGFLYSVHYAVRENEKVVRIVSVFNHSRNPYWG